MNQRRIIYSLVPVSLALATVVGAPVAWNSLKLQASQPTQAPSFEVLPVAHAGGGIDGRVYTNSFEAMDYSVGQGFRYIELDFSLTSDQQLVCLHDWRKGFTANFGYSIPAPLDLESFDQAVLADGGYTNCTARNLADWLKRNATVRIVTDIKDGSNLAGIRQLMTLWPDPKSRIIPQVFQPENVHTIVEMGFEQVIWTLYQYGGSNDDILRWVEQFGDSNVTLAVTMPKRLAVTDLPRRLSAMGVPTYVHTINRPEEAAAFRQAGISEIYTDFLAPDPN